MTDGARALIVGCGRIAGGFNEHDETAVLTHAVAYRRAGARLVACCDVDGERAEAFARRWGVERAGTDLGRLLGESAPTVVSLCAPPPGREEQLRAIFGTPSVRAVLVEKPIAHSVAQAATVAALVRAAGRPVLVDFPRAFDPCYRRLEQQARAGQLGVLRHGLARYYGPAAINACHWLERLLAMFGPARAARRLGGAVDRPLFEVELAAGAVLVAPGDDCAYSPFELDLLFSEQRLRVIDSERRVEHFRSVQDPLFPSYGMLERTTLWDDLAPSPETLGLAVRATLALAAGQAPVEWQPLFDRAVASVEIVHAVGAGA